MNAYVMNVLLTIVALVVSAGATYLMKYLNAKVGNEDLQKYFGWIKIAVQGIEQIMGPGGGLSKKEAAIKYIAEKFGSKISPEDLNKLIEAAVFEMNLVLKENGLENKPSLPRDSIEPAV